MSHISTKKDNLPVESLEISRWKEVSLSQFLDPFLSVSITSLSWFPPSFGQPLFNLGNTEYHSFVLQTFVTTRPVLDTRDYSKRHTAHPEKSQSSRGDRPAHRRRQHSIVTTLVRTPQETPGRLRGQRRPPRGRGSALMLMELSVSEQKWQPRVLYYMKT